MKRKGQNRKKRRIPVFSFSFRVVAVISMFLLLLSYLAAFISPEQVGFIGLFGIYFMPVFLLNLILLIAAIVRRSRSVWIPIVALLPSFFFAGYFFRVDFGKEAQIPEDAVRLLTYNTGRFSSTKDLGPEDCLREVAAFISEQAPDVVVLQEFKTSDTSAVRRVFKDYRYVQHFLLPYRQGGYFVGNVTLSKFPIESGGRIRFEGSTNMVMYSDIIVNDRPVRVYNVHLESNSISLTSLIKKMGGWEEFSDEFVHAHEKVQVSSSKRQLQTRALLEHAARSYYPSVICGDVNDTPMSYCFTALSRHRKDTFKEAGSGFGATYSMFWPLLRIDYVFVPEDAEVYAHYTPKVKYSDHYPVIATFGLN